MFCDSGVTISHFPMKICAYLRLISALRLLLVFNFSSSFNRIGVLLSFSKYPVWKVRFKKKPHILLGQKKPWPQMSVPLQAVNCGVRSEIRRPRAPVLTTGADHCVIWAGAGSDCHYWISYIGPRVADDCEVSDQTALSQPGYRKSRKSSSWLTHGPWAEVQKNGPWESRVEKLWPIRGWRSVGLQYFMRVDVYQILLN